MRRLQIDPNACRAADLAEAAAVVRGGGLVAFPTDTFYGLAVDPCSADAVHRLFEIKGRGDGEALPLVAASTRQVDAWCGPLPPRTAALAAAFWPGPLSVIVDAPPTVAAGVHAGRRTVAIRVPAHAVARALAEAVGSPVTATSANRSGSPPAQSADDLAWLAGEARVLIVDAGATLGGAPSTIVDARGARSVLVRAGAVPWDRVLESLNE